MSPDLLSPGVIAATALRATAGLAAGAGILWVHRWLRSRSTVVATIFGVGVLLRTVLGLALFWVSYLDLPLGRGLHLGDGFWLLALDGRLYFTTAATVGIHDWRSLGGSASPTYVKTLAVWMWLTGTSPASGMFLNLVLYALLCVLVVRLWRPRGAWQADLPCILLIGSFTLSPVLLIYGTQSMKDQFFAVLTATACCGAFLLLPFLTEALEQRRPAVAAALGFGLLWLAMFMMGGIRAYYSLVIWAILSGVVGLSLLRWPSRRFAWRLPRVAAVVVLTWFAYVLGAGVYATNTVELAFRVMGFSPGGSRAAMVVREALDTIQQARVGFLESGGATNIAGARVPEVEPDESEPDEPEESESEDHSDDAASKGAESKETRPGDAASGKTESSELDSATSGPRPGPAGGASGERSAAGETTQERGTELASVPTSGSGIDEASSGIVADMDLPGRSEPSMVRGLLVGLGTLFVPVSLLRALSMVQFPGGRSLLFITDVDTLFVNLTMVASVVLLHRRWDTARRHVPYVAFVCLLAFVMAFLLAYVVTNFGTMFRLRALVFVPVWMLALAAAPPPGEKRL